jgi:hypothetical protein
MSRRLTAIGDMADLYPATPIFTIRFAMPTSRAHRRHARKTGTHGG